MFTAIYAMEIKAFIKDFDHCRKPDCRTSFVEQLFSEDLLKHLSMAASINLQII